MTAIPEGYGLPRLREPLPWMEQAACLGHPNPDIWHPDGKTGPSAATREAIEICRECPVRDACLQHALEVEGGGHNSRWGIWAGFTPRDRAKMDGGQVAPPVPVRRPNGNAAKTHCKWGHEFTPENTYTHPTTGERRCRQCVRDRRHASNDGRVAS